MNNFVLSAHAVLPMFLIMAVGYLIKCTGLMDRSDVFKINKVSFHVFLPCMLFYSIYTSDISGSIRPSLMAYAILRPTHPSGSFSLPECAGTPVLRLRLLQQLLLSFYLKFLMFS